ncbi:MAG: Asp-tRNA(Asn)/Glu-tRNA(Gln) amidotransferase subunit GatC [Deltaproteobacteria bacterium]|nr:Asp-tRNA(Asn)/Glu-tRNA(Gln) amidotransferase subunit GatC [Deltaproteobacteria bacterium]
MKITSEEVRHVATLARLDLAQDEQERLAGELDRILEYMDKLSELDTDGVEPQSHAVDVVNVLRPDRVVNQPRTEDMLRNAPARDDDFLSVPKIIE